MSHIILGQEASSGASIRLPVAAFDRHVHMPGTTGSGNAECPERRMIVSIVTPVLNGGAVFAQCIESVIREREACRAAGLDIEVEHLIADGGSTDGSIRLVHETHRTGLFPRATWLRLLADVGFVAERVVETTEEDRHPRDVFVAVRPAR